jgi:hypothetical protein
MGRSAVSVRLPALFAKPYTGCGRRCGRRALYRQRITPNRVILPTATRINLAFPPSTVPAQYRRKEQSETAAAAKASKHSIAPDREMQSVRGVSRVDPE